MWEKTNNYPLWGISLQAVIIDVLFCLQEGLSLGVLPVSCFLLATLGILTTEHRANSVSLLLNSGVLALTQTVLRLIGETPSFFEFQMSLPWSLLYENLFGSFQLYFGGSKGIVVKTFIVTTKNGYCYLTSLTTAGPTPTTAGSHDNAEYIHAVLEEPRSRHQQQPIPTSGPELANMMKIGTRVMRGVDWKWGDQVSIIQSHTRAVIIYWHQ